MGSAGVLYCFYEDSYGFYRGSIGIRYCFCKGSYRFYRGSIGIRYCFYKGSIWFLQEFYIVSTRVHMGYTGVI